MLLLLLFTVQGEPMGLYLSLLKVAQNSTDVTFSTYTGIQEVANTNDMLNAQQYTQVLNELSIARGNGIIFSPEEINQIGSGTNWQREIYRFAKTTNHQLAVSGGGENNTYYASINYFD